MSKVLLAYSELDRQPYDWTPPAGPSCFNDIVLTFEDAEDLEFFLVKITSALLVIGAFLFCAGCCAGFVIGSRAVPRSEEDEDRALGGAARALAALGLVVHRRRSGG